MARLIKELRRRNVIRAGVTYVVASWVLLQVVDLLAPALHLPDSATRITLYALLIGFPIAMLLSWFYQITPEGISLDEDSDSESPKSKALDHRLNAIVIALLGAAVILFAVDKWWPKDVTDPSVAVLPFVNMSGLEENEYFSDGLTETLLHDIAQNPNLRVSARTSSFAFKDKHVDVREIARELGVANILEGSVQRAGDSLRITAQLIRASDGTHLWSAKYDRKIDDIFDIQDEIAASVGSRLTESLLSPAETTLPVGITTASTDAYELYLQAMAAYRIATFGALRESESLLKRALAADPGFTEATLLLALTYTALGDTNAMDFDLALESAETLYEQVLAKQPDNIDAQANLLNFEHYRAMVAGDPSKRASTIEGLGQLVEVSPNNVGARLRLAQILALDSQETAAIKQYSIALELDPLNTLTLELLSAAYSRMRQWDEARSVLERSLQIEPRQSNIRARLAALDLIAGNALASIRNSQKAIELDPLDHEMPYEIAQLLYELELPDEGDQFARAVSAVAPTSAAAESLELVRAIRSGDEEHSLEVARRMIRDDADDRQQTWIRSFRHLMLTAVRRDRTEQEMEFVREYLPDFENWDISVSWKVGLGRAHTLEIWRDLDDEQGIQNRLDHIQQGFAAINLDMARVEHVHIDYLLLRGDLEGAIQAALTGLYSHSVLEYLSIWDRFRNPLYIEFNADPRIAAAQEQWQREWVQAREDVRTYLAEQ